MSESVEGFRISLGKRPVKEEGLAGEGVVRLLTDQRQESTLSPLISGRGRPSLEKYLSHKYAVGFRHLFRFDGGR